MLPFLHIQFEGGQEVVMLTHRINRRLFDLSPIWGRIVALLQEDLAKEFGTKGSYSGEPWKPLKEVTKKIKRKRCPAEVENILVCSGRLKASLTSKNSDTVVLKKKTELEFGTGVPYAIYHQYGTENMPARRPLLFNPGTFKLIGNVILKYVYDDIVEE